MVGLFLVVIGLCGVAQGLVENKWTKIEDPLDFPLLRDSHSKFIRSSLNGNKSIRRSTDETLAALGQFPFQALLISKYSDGNSYTCGGSIISFNWILTNAQCLNGKVSADVYVGVVNLKPMSYIWGMKVKDDDLWPHEKFDASSITNNIGLVHLLSGIPKSKNVNVINLPTRSEPEDHLLGSKGTIIGFGRISTEPNGASTVLRWVEVPIIGNDVCQKKFGTTIFQSNICAEIKSGKSSCYGDNGGPLTVLRSDGTTELVGVVSYGSIDECDLDLPAVFTRVHSFFDWIQSRTLIHIS